MKKLAGFLFMILMILHSGYSQEEDKITTVLFSSLSTPDQLHNLIDDVKERGIYLDIDKVEWNETKTQIKSIHLAIQFLKKGDILKNNVFGIYKYNDLTEGTIILLQSGGKFPVRIMANSKQIFDGMRDIIIGDVEKNNVVYTNFSEPFDAKDETLLNKVAVDLKSHFRASNELVYQIRKERDPGSIRYMYRYYYNGKRLDGSFGISELDMTCEASIDLDDEGVLSLFIDSVKKLSPVAVLEN